MTDRADLPKGMRLNNPGNLRQASLPDHRTKIVDGLNSFDTLELGCEALARVVFGLYTHVGARTMRDFVARFTVGSGTDVLSYAKFLARDMKQSPLGVETLDLRLDKAWNALCLMRAVVAIEQGRPRLDWLAWPEWITPGMWVWSMSNTRFWKDVSFNA